MTTTRIRTAIAIALTTVGVAAVPAVSHASTNDGRYWRSIAASDAKAAGNSCAGSLNLYNDYNSLQQQAIASGDYATSFYAVDQEAKTRNDARSEGCGWAWT